MWNLILTIIVSTGAAVGESKMVALHSLQFVSKEACMGAANTWLKGNEGRGQLSAVCAPTGERP